MKEYTRLMAEYDPATTHFITHEWGQTAVALYNRVVRAMNKADDGDLVVITSYKKFGIKTAVQFMNDQGLSCAVVGKGPDNLRLVECPKVGDAQREEIITERPVEFEFRGQEFGADVGDAIFSKSRLDAGTRHLLETFLDGTDLSGKRIGDLGSGWGAVSMVVAATFPDAEVVAFERDEASFRASEKNLAAYPNVTALLADLNSSEDPEIASREGSFDVLLSNPPFHVTPEERYLFFRTAGRLLGPEGVLMFVTEKPFTRRFQKAIAELFQLVNEMEDGGYVVSKYRHWLLGGTPQA